MGRQPQTKAARALALAKKIAEVEAEIAPLKEILKELRVEYDLLFEEERPAKRPPKPPIDQGRRVASGPLTERALAFVLKAGPGGVTLDQISEAAGHPSRQTLRAAMCELSKARRVQRIRNGVYAPPDADAPQIPRLLAGGR